MAASSHRWVVDSLEELTASIEVDGEAMITIPQSMLPHGVREGHVLRVKRQTSADGQRSTVTIELDEADTQRTMAASAKQVKRAGKQKQDPGGDITL